jgi:putative intracellular protease/amidase
MAKKVLIVLSGHGYWGEELIGPLEALDAAGYETDFVTPKGTKPQALPPSMDDTYVDPPLGRPVTTKEMAEKVKTIEKSNRLTTTSAMRRGPISNSIQQCFWSVEADRSLTWLTTSESTT